MNPFFLAMTALQNSAILAAPDFAKKIPIEVFSLIVARFKFDLFPCPVL